MKSKRNMILPPVPPDIKEENISKWMKEITFIIQEMNERVYDDLNTIYPVGCFYTQYPDDESSTLSVAFPDKYSPSELFGGVWEKQWDTENIFFRTEGANYQTRTTGLSADQMQGHYHAVGDSGHYHSAPDGEYFVTYKPAVTLTHTYSYTTTNAYHTHVMDTASKVTGVTVLAPTTYGAYGTPRVGVVTEPRNRLVRIWKRTA